MSFLIPITSAIFYGLSLLASFWVGHWFLLAGQLVWAFLFLFASFVLSVFGLLLILQMEIDFSSTPYKEVNY